ncbi:hypothetical protein PVAND_002165 [Polypedilum vanderplanki]|uniref:DUF1907 domain-containing protein n=1 Tax=Polypedilum vanderplanki TaxID=319348 RepID=A0A9J6BQ61_POLVA|nr:hypothetical protein PVAND_002165 [Polypedilum vanderplanki]
MSALEASSLNYEVAQTFEPDLETLAKVFEKGLKANFADVKVEIVDCPDLTQAPFNLAASGLSGDQVVLEYGGPPYLLPLVNKSKVYDLVSLIRHIKGYETKKFFILGAGAGPFPLIDQNCEGIYNLHVSQNGQVTNGTHYAKTITGGDMELSIVPNSETRTALLGNLYLSEGNPGKIIKVICKKRIGDENFISAMQKQIAEEYKNQLVAVGGAFVMRQGKAKQHVMDQFSKTPLNTEEELNNWLKFYNMPAPLVALGTFVSNEADLDLRLQHFHSFSDHGHGGHYHYDTTPEIVEYEGYFNTGSRVVRIDKPIVTHKIGRD